MKLIWNKWKEITVKIGDFQASIIFSVLYFILFTPVGLIYSMFNDILKNNKAPAWEEHDVKLDSLEDLKSQ